MKKMFVLVLFLASLVSTAFAETESPEAVCKAEADEVKFETEAEYNAYIQDCIAQVSEDRQQGDESQEIVQTQTMEN